MKSFLLYFDMQESFEKLSDEQAGKLIKALFRYATTREETAELDPAADMLFAILQRAIDRDTEKYNRKILARAEAGRKGGLAKAANYRDSVSSRDSTGFRDSSSYRDSSDLDALYVRMASPL